MSALSLFALITLAILLQVAVFLGYRFSRHWQRYRQLEDAAQETAVDTAIPTAEKVSPPPGAWRDTRKFRVAERVVESPDGSVCSFHLTPEDGLPLPAFLPGQFLTFELDMPEGGKLIRCYSLSDTPRADRYRVSIKRLPAPPGRGLLPPGRSSTHFHDRVAVGSTLNVRAPAGHFYIGPEAAPVVLIAGGIGITPLMSMLEWCLENQPEREVWLFYGVRNGRELAMRERLESQASRYANFHLQFCFSDPLPEETAGRDFHHAGRVSLDLLRMLLPLKPYHFYICGPGPMMAAMVAGLEDWGVPDARIHFEAFGPASFKRRQPTSATEAPDPDIVVTFARSGVQVPWRPGAGSLLDFAEQEGINVDSSCRGGACGTCRTTLSAGEVVYHQPPDYDPEPGTCLLCVCTPKTNVTLEA
ncbi:MAG: 2Fe-2S iron-sulfur cluster binding domain-containing protein [Gammaproteobacteria bacterium]|nr:2Fe-2S iron-sulfur cluster binding domain-containing protein [Gammaproteobacteria bacterium]MBU1414635.1 2Fe-2S iron-sulfur cluster binding domain-containing protein [Gammaproteobacteria bacterium]